MAFKITFTQIFSLLAIMYFCVSFNSLTYALNKNKHEKPAQTKQKKAILQKSGKKEMNAYIKISISGQKLYLYRDNQVIKEYRISTSKYGIGNAEGSNMTPLGKHRVASKIGANAPENAIFKSRINTKKLAVISHTKEDTRQDLVTSRILWLDGLEEGKNKGGNIDSYKRNIYIHGTSEEGLIGIPSSHGCVRMYNKDVIELFDLVAKDTIVYIEN